MFRIKDDAQPGPDPGRRSVRGDRAHVTFALDKTSPRAWQRLFDAENPTAAAPPQKSKPPSATPPRDALLPRLHGWLELGGTCYAAEGDSSEAELQQVLEGYRAAYEHKDLAAIGRYYVDFTDEQRAALARYLRTADELRVAFTNLRVTVMGDRAAVAFTREDHFVDHDTGEAQQVVVRLTKIFSKRPEGWQILPEE